MKKKLLTLLGPTLFLLAGVALGAALVLALRPSASLPAAPPITAAPAPSAAPAGPVPSSAPTASVPEEDPALSLDGEALPPANPDGRLTVTDARKGYTDGALRLIIPKLSVDVPVLNGVDKQTLLRGVGLYDYAQLPGEGDDNVSIAGHRNGLRGGKITDNMPFYYINTLTEGDYLYLRDAGHIYQYRWQLTQVIAPDNWDPIRTQGFSCLTLTTCTPIGVADHRLVVRGELVKVLPLEEGYSYPSSTTEEVSS